MGKFTMDIVTYLEETQTVIVTKESFESLKERANDAEHLKDFALWVAREIFDDMWEFNEDAFAEIACRKLAKLGIVKDNGDTWEYIESHEGGSDEFKK